MKGRICGTLQEALDQVVRKRDGKLVAPELDWSPSRLSSAVNTPDEKPFPANDTANRLIRVQQYTDDHSFFLTMGHLLGYDMMHSRLRSESAPILLERLLAKQESMHIEIQQLALGLRGESLRCAKAGKR